MTAKELIQQYVTAHADNRWMDASELETLLTEFAEKLQEPASEDSEKAARHYLLNVHASPLNAIMHEADLKAEMQYHKDIENAFKAGTQWQKEQMMKGAVDGEVNIWGSHILLPRVLPPEFSKQRVKVIIIKE